MVYRKACWTLQYCFNRVTEKTKENRVERIENWAGKNRSMAWHVPCQDRCPKFGCKSINGEFKAKTVAISPLPASNVLNSDRKLISKNLTWEFHFGARLSKLPKMLLWARGNIKSIQLLQASQHTLRIVNFREPRSFNLFTDRSKGCIH